MNIYQQYYLLPSQKPPDFANGSHVLLPACPMTRLVSICPASRHFSLMNALTLESYPGMYSHHVLHFFCMKILTNTLQSSTAFLYRKAHFCFWIALSSKQQYLAMQNSPENSPDCCGTKTALTRKFKLNIFQWMTNLGLPEASESPKCNAN